MTTEQPSVPVALKDESEKERDTALAAVDTAFRTAADDLRLKGAAVAELLRRGEVLMEKYQVIAQKAQRYKAWCDATGRGGE